MTVNLVKQLSLPGVDVPLTCQQDGDPQGGKAECPPWGARTLVSWLSCGLHPAAQDLAVSYFYFIPWKIKVVAPCSADFGGFGLLFNLSF